MGPREAHFHHRRPYLPYEVFFEGLCTTSIGSSSAGHKKFRTHQSASNSLREWHWQRWVFVGSNSKKSSHIWWKHSDQRLNICERCENSSKFLELLLPSKGNTPITTIIVDTMTMNTHPWPTMKLVHPKGSQRFLWQSSSRWSPVTC